MGAAKDILVKPISASDAREVVKAYHYSGKVVNNSQLHLGVFLGERCGGAMQFGPSLDKRKMLGLVKGTLWNEFLELNRMAFADWLPRNSESRAIGFAMRWIRKTYPWIKWVVSFSDATQCGDGTIYRASGFVLTQIKKNNTVWELPWKSDSAKRGRLLSRVTATKGGHVLEDGAASTKGLVAIGAKPIPGFQIRYLYFLHPQERENLTVPVLPFSEITRCGAGMYLGKSRAGSAAGGTSDHQSEGGGSTPTPALLDSPHGPQGGA